MYPDIEDVRQTMHRLTGVPRPNAEDIWPTVVLVREFVSYASRWCRNHGRHRYILASELLQQAEKSTGKLITPYEFCLTFWLALPHGCCQTRIPYSIPIDVAAFDTLKIKFPPIDRLEEFRELWDEVYAQTEREIIRERQRLALSNFSFGRGTQADYNVLTEEQRRMIAAHQWSQKVS